MALKFNGSNGVVNIGNVPELDFERTDSFSLSVWIKTSTTDFASLFSKLLGSGSLRGWDLFIGSTGVISMHLINTWPSNAIREVTTAVYNDGNLHHVGMTYDGSSSASGVIIYVDGVAVASTASNDSLSATIVSNGNAAVGARNANSLFYDGISAEPAAWLAELSATEMMALARGTKPNMIRRNSLKYYSTLDNKSPLGLDISGYNNHGKVTGTKPALNPPQIKPEIKEVIKKPFYTLLDAGPVANLKRSFIPAMIG